MKACTGNPTSTTSRSAALAAAVLIISGLFAGCSDFVPPETHSGLVDRTTRQGILDGLENAYNDASLEMLLECFSDSLAFHLEPGTATADPTLPDSWGVRAEATIHADAFGSRTSAESLTLELTREHDPLELEGPTPDSPSRWQYFERYAINADIGGVPYEVNGYATFTLAQHKDDYDMYGNRLWNIIDWTDTGDVPCRPDEVTNWTELKLLLSKNCGQYPLRTSVSNVIGKLDYAYEARDALAVLDCFADSFRFWLNENDVSSNPGLPRSWGLATEATIMWNMLGHESNVLGADIRFTEIETVLSRSDVSRSDVSPPNAARRTLPGARTDAPPADDDRSEAYVYAYIVTLALPNGWTLHADASCRFLLAVDQDETGPSGETLWEITRWEDIDDPPAGGRPDEREEAASWGIIKALYR